MSISRSGRLYRTLRGVRNRAIIARKRLAQADPTAYIHPSSHVATDLVAGPYVFIGRNCSIPPLVTIGKYTMLASKVALVGDDHNWHEPGIPMQFSGRPAQQKTRIGADAWLGHGVTVRRGVTIGDGSIIAAGAVVTKDVPAFEVWAGVPAERIRTRFKDSTDRAEHERMLRNPTFTPQFAERLETLEPVGPALNVPHDRIGATTRTHVCILTSAHPIDDVRVNSKVAASFIDRGYKVSWVGPEVSYFNAVSDRDPRIEYHLTKPSRNRLDRLLSAQRVGRKASEVEGVDWFYSPDPDAAEVAVRLAVGTNARVVFDIHEIFHGALLDKWLLGRKATIPREYIRRRIARTVNRSDLVMAVSRSVLRPYADPEQAKLVVRNCAPRWFGQAAESDDPGGHERNVNVGSTVFMHGKALPGNGTPTVLEAVGRLGKDRTQAKVVMFPNMGQGQPLYLPDLPERIEQLGLGNSIWLHDAVTHTDMPGTLNQCDVGMISYGRRLGEDSLPNRLFEYMAIGMAVMAPCYAGEIKAIIDAEDIGLTVDFENPDDVATAMRWFIEHPVETADMGRRARIAFLARHNWDTEFDHLVQAMR